MPKWAKPANWEEIPFDPNATPEQKAKEFDAQYRANQSAAEDPKPTATDEFPNEKGKHRRD